MAYKFQLGAATLSGSVTLKEAAEFESGFSNNDQNITNVGVIEADTIQSDADANGLNINFDGNTTKNLITLKDNLASALDINEGGNSYLLFDTQNSAEVMVASKKVRIADDTKLAFGNGDDASFEYDEDGTDTLLYAGASIRISDDTKLEFGTGGDASFEYDEDGNDVLLYAGANIRIPDDTKIEFGAAGDAGIEYDEDGTDQLRIHGSTAGVVVMVGGGDVLSINSDGNATFAGNLTVQGETTTVDSTTINISSSFTFEGPADDHETTLQSGTPISDTNIQLPQLGVAGTYYLPALVNNPGGAGAISASVGEINLVDGDATVGTTALADADGFLHNDNGTMRQTQVVKIAELAFSKVSGDATIASGGALTIEANAVEGSMLNNNIVSGLTDIGAAIADTDELIVSDNGTIRRSDFSRLKTYIGSGTTTVTSGSNAAALAAGVNYFGAHGGAITATLPGASEPTVGDSVKIKAGSDCSTTNKLTVNAYANHTIDGVSSLILESPFAAVECIYVVSGSWRVF